MASGSEKIVTQLNVLKETGSSAYKHLFMHDYNINFEFAQWEFVGFFFERYWAWSCEHLKTMAGKLLSLIRMKMIDYITVVQ